MKAKSELAGKKVTILSGTYKGMTYWVEDWWENVSGSSWMFADGNPACLKYAARIGLKDSVPFDDDVLYGKIGSFGELIHISEIENEHKKEQPK